MSRRSNLETRPTQTARLIDFLRSRKGQWVPLPEILALRISQYSARLWEARHRLGLKIENKIENVNGTKRSWFRLVEHQHVPTVAEKPIVGLFPTSELERTARWEDCG